MAKLKKKRVTKSKSKIRKPMATKRRRKKRRSSSTSIIRRTTMSAKPRRRRKKRSFLSANGGLMMSVKNNGVAAIGGSMLLLTRFFKLPLWARTAAGFGGAVGLSSMMNAPMLAAGLAGATAYDLGGRLLSSTGMLNDDLEDVDYVDPNSLSDTGMIDDNGNQIVMDEDGIAYALNEAGDLEAIGDAYALQESMQSVSMLPLQDAYALAAGY